MMTKMIVPGPTYGEMRNPLLLSAPLREAANAARSDELNPVNLFNINWKHTGDGVDRIVLPKELTGVQANIVVLSGRTFPSGRMKVGPAYATLAENEALNHLRPGDRTVIGPTTGHFGIATASASLGAILLVVLGGHRALGVHRERRGARVGGVGDVAVQHLLGLLAISRVAGIQQIPSQDKRFFVWRHLVHDAENGVISHRPVKRVQQVNTQRDCDEGDANWQQS